MARLRNLVKRSSGSYMLRIFVPTDLIPRFGRQEITRSLRTSRLPEAERLATLCKAGILRIFAMARQNPALTAPDLDAMAKAYFARIWAQAEQDLACRRFGPTEKARLLDNHGEALTLIGRWKRSGEVQNAVAYFDAELKETARVHARPGTPEYSVLCDKILSARADYHRGLFDALMHDVPAVASGPPTATRIPAPPSESVQALIRAFIDEHESTRAWARKTVLKHRGNLVLLPQMLGSDKPVAEITKADIRAVKNMLGQLPANWSKLYPGRRPLEAATESKRAGRAPMTPGAANAYLASISSFLSWCVKQGYIADNPALKIKLPETVRAIDKRSPFTVDQLNRIFRAPVYTGMRSKFFWSRPGIVREKGSKYWIPLVGAFSGMRLGEIINLVRSDVRAVEGIPCMDIRQAKTRAGVRKVPVHPQLQALGFLDYVNAIPVGQRLFGDTSEDAFSKFFGRFLTECGLVDRKLVFHSFRHTFNDAMRCARIDSPVAKALIGHAEGTVTAIYGNGYPVAVLSEAMASVRYDGLDLSHLRA
ncbi:MAG: DUF6538 domain-containing protein [Gemmatimonas sp.]